MSEIENYYRRLGVSPDSTPDQIKKAFREKIKLHHPDRAVTEQDAESARLLIEAYQAIKNAPPIPPRSVRHGNTSREPNAAYSYDSSSASTYSEAYRFGHRVFNEMLKEREKRLKSHFEKTMGQSQHKDKDEHLQKQKHAGSSRALESFDRAEDYLKNSVRKFDRQRGRPSRAWKIEYLRHLNEAQILFRDVANRHPSQYSRALDRLNQISELIQTIKKMA